MPCLIGCLALFMPRVALVLVWLFSSYLKEPYPSFLWPLLGFFFLPLTTLAYAWAYHYGDPAGTLSGPGLIVVIVAVLFDLGLLGTAESDRRRRGR